MLYYTPRGFSPGNPVFPSPQKQPIILIWFLYDVSISASAPLERSIYNVHGNIGCSTALKCPREWIRKPVLPYLAPSLRGLLMEVLVLLASLPRTGKMILCDSRAQEKSWSLTCSQSEFRKLGSQTLDPLKKFLKLTTTPSNFELQATIFVRCFYRPGSDIVFNGFQLKGISRIFSLPQKSLHMPITRYVGMLSRNDILSENQLNVN